ncbi:hypothetical protein [Ramlibacter albus]|uniref:Uncharacterized protein n=1 Tax=Ramlibacter albus TaxID=2079448 RepID=A0A923M570_9BURK|nr:hypothetical protein [Ramlibacter albus]MBC5764160.1 hypothetical protein [Ramlibacter albus]
MSAQLAGRNMFIWRLAPVVKAEIGVAAMARKAEAAGLSGVWIKIAEGDEPFDNVRPRQLPLFKEVLQALREKKVSVWGWHVPHGGSVAHAAEEGAVAAQIAIDLGIDGVLMDAEGGSGYFNGGAVEADAYASALRSKLSAAKLGIAMCGNDIPKNFPGYAFDAFVKHARFNAPQVYYGASPSVNNRLERAIKANAHVKVPFVPVGAAWIGTGDGGCETASACAERAREFLRLVDEHGFVGCSFWHWMGAPAAFWQVMVETAQA